VTADPKKNRLALKVEDHDLSRLDFEDPTPVEGVPGGVNEASGTQGPKRPISSRKTRRSSRCTANR